MQALLKKKWPIVQYMNEDELYKMSQDAKLSQDRQEIVLKHLRAHFGRRAFASNRKQRELRRNTRAEPSDETHDEHDIEELNETYGTE